MQRYPRWLPYAVMLAAALWQLWPAVWDGALPLPAGHLVREAHFAVSPDAAGALAGRYLAGATDAATFSLPHYVHLWRSLRAGELPLWEPYSTCGHPFLAEGESAVFYPPNWLGVVLSPAAAFILLIVVDFLLREFGMYLLLRCGAVAPLYAAAGGVAYALSGFYTSWLGNLGMTATAGWLPWLLVLYEQAVRRRRRGWLIAGCLAVALQCMPGHMQTVAYNCLALAGYALLRAVLAPLRCRRAAAVGAVMLVLGGLLAAPQLLPLLAQLPGSVRVQQQELQLTGFDQLALFFDPDLFVRRGVHAQATFIDLRSGQGETGTVHPTETGSFIGTVTLYLALGALAALSRRGWLFTGLAAAALLLVFSETAQRLPVTLLPPLGAMYHRRALLLVQFALLAAGIFGLQRLTPHRALLRLLLYTAPALLILLAARTDARAVAAAFACPLLLTLGAWLRLPVPRLRLLAVILLLGEMLLYAHGRNAFAPAATVARLLDDVAREAQAAAGEGRVRDRAGELLPDGFDLLLPVRGIAGHQALRVDAYARLQAFFEPVDPAVQRLRSCEAFAIPWTPPVSERFCRLLSVRTVYSRVPLPWSRRNVPECPVGAYAVPDPLPRAAVLPCAVTADDTRALVLLQESSFPLARCAVLAPGAPAHAGDATGRARIVRETGATLTVRAQSSAPAVLLLTDAYAPGWSATVNGAPVPVWRANVAFRAVPLPAGTSTVVFTYHSPALTAGLLCAAAAAAMLLLWWRRA